MSNIKVRLCGAAMDGVIKIPEEDYGKNISVDYHIGTKVHKCIFEYRSDGRYFLIALLPYAEKDFKSKDDKGVR